MKTMKKALCLILVFAMLALTAMASREIRVMVDGKYIDFDVQPQVINSRTMVPVRAIFEELGADVEWDNATRTVIAMKDGVIITATIGSKKIYIDGKERLMDVAPTIVGGRTLVPARFVAEALGCDVQWDGARYEVIIKSAVNLGRIISESDAVSAVQDRLEEGMVAKVEYSFNHNGKAYYQIAVTEKKFYDPESNDFYMSRITSYILNKDGTELFEGFYNAEKKELINYELIEE